jgi:hypothetical protein
MFKVLNKTRKAPLLGDVFKVLMANDEVFNGVVVDCEVSRFQCKNLYTIWFYNSRCDEPDLNAMFGHPMIVSKLMWSRGYFKPVQRNVLVELSIVYGAETGHGILWYDKHGERVIRLGKTEVKSPDGVYTERGVYENIDAWIRNGPSEFPNKAMQGTSLRASPDL